MRPNGLAYDHRRQLVLAANVGDPAMPGSHHAVHGRSRAAARVRAEIAVPRPHALDGVRSRRRRSSTSTSSSPPQIVVVDPRQPDRIARTIAVPACRRRTASTSTRRPRRLFCACDAGVLVTLDARIGQGPGREAAERRARRRLLQRQRQQLYVAVGDPGVIDVFDTASMAKLGDDRDRAGRAHHGAVAVRRLALRLPAGQPSRRALPAWPTPDTTCCSCPHRRRASDGLTGLCRRGRGGLPCLGRRQGAGAARRGLRTCPAGRITPRARAAAGRRR